MFVFDLYLSTPKALLFGRLDADALAVRGVVIALAMPLAAAWRRAAARDWIGRLQVSRSAAFYSATLLLVGGYLLLMAGVGYYVRDFGGDWGRALQIALAARRLLGAGGADAVGHAARAAARLRRQALLQLPLRLPRGVAALHRDAVVARLAAGGRRAGRARPGRTWSSAPAGSLWLRGGDGAATAQAARWNMPEVDAAEPADCAAGAPSCASRAGSSTSTSTATRRAATATLAAARRGCGSGPTPGWSCRCRWPTSCSASSCWRRPRTPLELNWEVRDLLKTAARQAAGILAQMQATEALLEARKFEAFNRMSAFVVHDLKNIVTQLSLMMKNAQRHARQPRVPAGHADDRRELAREDAPADAAAARGRDAAGRRARRRARADRRPHRRRRAKRRTQRRDRLRRRAGHARPRGTPRARARPPGAQRARRDAARGPRLGRRPRATAAR
ncbi:MAG: hypothetical protein MZW92_21085 [Comamonadaceae bacterium]|nr:hypothetical protein [Comamonadaceae bacterium]